MEGWVVLNYFIGAVIAIGFIVSIFVFKSRGRSELLNRQNPDDVDDFIGYFESKGYTRKFLDLSIKILREQFLNRNFIPNIEHSFVDDYQWTKTLIDQYSTYQMRYAGIILRDIKAISITESDWAKYQETNGLIDNFDQLFDYVIGKLPERIKPQYFVAPS